MLSPIFFILSPILLVYPDFLLFELVRKLLVYSGPPENRGTEEGGGLQFLQIFAKVDLLPIEASSNSWKYKTTNSIALDHFMP